MDSCGVCGILLQDRRHFFEECLEIWVAVEASPCDLALALRGGAWVHTVDTAPKDWQAYIYTTKCEGVHLFELCRSLVLVSMLSRSKEMEGGPWSSITSHYSFASTEPVLLSTAPRHMHVRARYGFIFHHSVSSDWSTINVCCGGLS